ncbi:MAG TPA: isocitrate lyase/phosphoenolpyruvate mutase family protein [Pseudonocardiaceae bacterium]|nr:isocitrate lyase/phosphoenolpyruvate mutase family protein [Pseudonocardiaceae bacterium]
MTFRDLHYGDTPLLLPNAWDVPSALAFVEAGFPAIGTTSFGVASSIGRPDGTRSTRDANAALARVLVTLPVYVSLDIEDGYSDDPATVADYVAGLGVAGVNIEDSTEERLVAPEAHAEKLAAVKARCPDVFLNARVDTHWFGQEVATTVSRALAYVDAGADGVFVPGVADPDVVRDLAARIPVPLNVLPGRPLAELAELGVRRVSTGSLPYRAALHAAVEVADALRSGRPVPDATPYGELQDRMVAFTRR